VERTTIAGETEVLGENLHQRHFVPPQIPHDQVRFRAPDRSGGKPATNRLSYGAAIYKTSYSGTIVTIVVSSSFNDNSSNSNSVKLNKWMTVNNKPEKDREETSLRLI
jgi:hypothetical protein